MSSQRVDVRERVRRRLKAPTRRVLRRLGYELVPRASDESADLLQMMRTAGITLLVDVGANQGQYAERMRAAGFDGQIISFEPGRDAYSYLLRAAERDELWDTRRQAVGDERGELMLNLSANSVSSSLLDVNSRHVAAERRSAVVSQEAVDVVRLDEELTLTGRPTMLKVDTQGYELPVLRGAAGLRPEIHLIQLEVSLVELYGGQATYLDVLHELDAMGFVPCLVLPGFTDPVTRETLQVDIVAKRTNRFG